MSNKSIATGEKTISLCGRPPPLPRLADAPPSSRQAIAATVQSPSCAE
jgi:hypothetical protein